MRFPVPSYGPLTPPEIVAEIQTICARTVLEIPKGRTLWDELLRPLMRKKLREARDAAAREEALRQESLRQQASDTWF